MPEGPHAQGSGFPTRDCASKPEIVYFVHLVHGNQTVPHLGTSVSSVFHSPLSQRAGFDFSGVWAASLPPSIRTPFSTQVLEDRILLFILFKLMFINSAEHGQSGG